MKNRWLLVISCLLFSQSVLAKAPKPDACPSISALKRQTLKYAESEEHYRWKVWVNSSLNTPETWTLEMEVAAFPGGSRALHKANNRLLSLNQMIGPFDNGQGGWICRYDGERPDDDQDANIAYATTPVKN